MRHDSGFLVSVVGILALCCALYLLSVRASEKAKADCENLGGNLIVTRNGDVCLQKGVVLK